MNQFYSKTNQRLSCISAAQADRAKHKRKCRKSRQDYKLREKRVNVKQA